MIIIQIMVGQTKNDNFIDKTLNDFLFHLFQIIL